MAHFSKSYITAPCFNHGDFFEISYNRTHTKKRGILGGVKLKLNQEAVCKVGSTLVKGIVNIVNDDYSDPYYHFYIQDENGISEHPLILASDKVKILIK